MRYITGLRFCVVVNRKVDPPELIGPTLQQCVCTFDEQTYEMTHEWVDVETVYINRDGSECRAPGYPADVKLELEAIE